MSNNTAVVPTASRSTQRVTPAEHWSNKDPCEWPTRAASRVVVAHDYGVSNDHSTIVAAGLWHMEGRQVMGIFHAEQMPLNEPPSQIAASLAGYVNTLRPDVLVMDTRGQISHAEQVMNNVFTPVVGISMTGQEYHSTMPNLQPIMLHGKRVGLSVYSLGRTPLIEALEPLVERGELQITQEGRGALIIRELSDMEVLVNETTGNRRWATNPGLHDDMAVSAGMARWALHDLILRTATKTAPRMSGRITPPPPSGGWT